MGGGDLSLKLNRKNPESIVERKSPFLIGTSLFLYC